MKITFSDTSYFVAIINERDQLHKKAATLKDQLGETGILVKSESVLIETLNYFAEFNIYAKQLTLTFVQEILLNPSVEIVEQTNHVFHDGMKFYGERLDKGYSLTDCISMNICRERGITEILTNDHHFEQEGFRVLL